MKCRDINKHVDIHMTKEVCPVCHMPGYRVIMKRRNKLYIYYKHFERVGDRKIQRNCYVGPVGGYDVKTVERAVKQLDVEKIYMILTDDQRRRLAQLLC